MKNIAGSYPKNNELKDFSFQMPEKWEELEPQQFSRIIEVLHFRKADKFTIAVSLISLLAGANNWPVLNELSEVKAETEDDLSGDELLNALIPLTNFLYESKPPVKNFYHTINLRKVKHISPADDLSNLCFGEWCFAHQYYIYYQITEDKMWLDKLIATIYRPIDANKKTTDADYNGDMRIFFNENLIDQRALSVANVEHHIKLGILTWFSCALGELSESRPHVFPPAPQVDPENPQTPEPVDADHSRTWMTIFRELLGPKFGTPEVLKFTNAMFILDELEDKHISFEEAKKQN